ncbi:MAG TPA: ABC transporter permease [Ktedonobacteraceae bacterium]|nr:ABC transporter permease [Ktedonobacteraceae bacterium]
MQVTNTSNLNSGTMLSRVRSGGRGVWGIVTSNGKITFGVGVVLFFILVAIFAPLLTPYNPNAFMDVQSAPPSAAHWLGTTPRGEDVFSQLIYGTRASLLIGFIAAIGSTLLQVLFGTTSAYFGGFIDDFLSLIINIFLVLPGLPLAIVLASFSPIKGSVLLAVILLFTSWSYGARVLRAQTLSLKEREFVAAARASGESSTRLIFAEILPNEIALVVSNFVTTFVYTILAEVALEFLGLGDISHSSWGVILFWAQSDNALLGGEWWRFVPPGLCVAILCSGLTFINSGIDELANPRLRREKPVQVARSLSASPPATAEQHKEEVAQ